MRNTYNKEWFNRLDEALTKAKGYAGGSAELEAFLSAHLVVLLAGAYEDCVEHMFTERAARTGDPEIQHYVQSTCDLLFRNPKFENIVRALKHFGDGYVNAFQTRIDTSAREAISSIVTNKNNVAHGKVSTVTIGDVENFHKRSLPIFDALEDVLGLA